MRSFFMSGILVLVSSLSAGCGDLKLGDGIAIRLDPETQQAQVDVQMSDGLEIAMDGQFPIADGKGSIEFVRATRTENAKIRINANLASFLDDRFGVANTLPNGAPFPVAITPPLMRIEVVRNKNFDVDALFSLTPELQLGTTVGIAQFSSKYVPTGIAVCQNFRNSERVAFAAICLYGPTATVKGGIFAGANFGNVLNIPTIDPLDDDLVAELEASEPFMMNLNARSFAASSSQAKRWTPGLEVPALSMSSSNWEASTFDPSRKLKGSTAQKAVNNVEKVLRVRR